MHILPGSINRADTNHTCHIFRCIWCVFNVWTASGFTCQS